MNRTEAETLDFLLSPAAIRSRTQLLYNLALQGGTHFEVQLDRLDQVADFVVEVTRANYPDLKIPFHSRWGHFQAADVNRLAELQGLLKTLDPIERARTKLDLAVVSVLLDAGAGPEWSYTERQTSKTVIRSEGLAVASFRMFLSGAFSSDPSQPLRVDAQGLRLLTLEKLAEGFQVDSGNPLVGLEGRLALMHALGDALKRDPQHFGTQSRPGYLYDFLAKNGSKIAAVEVLSAVLRGLGPIWPGRIQWKGVNLGDVWAHPALGDPTDSDSWVPFHKLSQWMSYSLIEPLEEAGLTINRVDELTGLAEYRNGGLLLDRGLITLRDPLQAQASHPISSPLVIEWRALTVKLLDDIADRVRSRLGLNSTEFPLAKILEGGTWHAGRKAAAQMRKDGSAPLKISSDGTVF